MDFTVVDSAAARNRQHPAVVKKYVIAANAAVMTRTLMTAILTTKSSLMAADAVLADAALAAVDVRVPMHAAALSRLEWRKRFRRPIG
jgi:acetoin utilization deacetylase AcuC-like enzyme